MDQRFVTRWRRLPHRGTCKVVPRTIVSLTVKLLRVGRRVLAGVRRRCDEVAAGLVAVLQRHQAQQQRRALREQEQQQQLLQQVQEQQRRQEEADKQHNHPSSGSPHSYRGEGTGAVCKDGTCPGAQQQQPSGVWAAGKDEEAGVTPGMAGGGGGGGRLVSFRGDVVYGGSSYADQFAELLRRGDTQVRN